MKAMRKKLNIFTFQLAVYYILQQGISIGVNARRSCQDVFLNISPNAQANTSAKVRKPFFKEHLRWLLLKCGHCKIEARKIDCLCFREVDGMLTASAKIREI